MTSSFIIVALLHCKEDLTKKLSHLNTLTEAKITDKIVLEDFEKDKLVV